MSLYTSIKLINTFNNVPVFLAGISLYIPVRSKQCTTWQYILYCDKYNKNSTNYLLLHILHKGGEAIDERFNEG